MSTFAARSAICSSAFARIEASGEGKRDRVLVSVSLDEVESQLAPKRCVPIELLIGHRAVQKSRQPTRQQYGIVHSPIHSHAA